MGQSQEHIWGPVTNLSKVCVLCGYRLTVVMEVMHPNLSEIKYCKETEYAACNCKEEELCEICE